jgi:hypothetical protein
MKTNKVLLAAVLAIAMGAPVAGFLGDMNGQPKTFSRVRVPFLHGFSTGQIASRAEFSSLERAGEWLNWPPLTNSATSLARLSRRGYRDLTYFSEVGRGEGAQSLQLQKGIHQ